LLGERIAYLLCKGSPRTGQMTADSILVTGGAGFIGSHLVDRLVASGRAVRVLDVLEPQVHGDSNGYRNPDAEYVEGSVLDRELLDATLEGVEAVVHLAAQVGVGQSMYDMTRYVRDNCLGTAVLLEALAQRKSQLSALVVASSMSIYGEGRYSCAKCDVPETEVLRTADALRERRWEPVCLRCGTQAIAEPTPEGKRLAVDSVYAATKRDQEELALVFSRADGGIAFLQCLRATPVFVEPLHGRGGDLREPAAERPAAARF
jgi:dTDP-L-rhamnose 4-epimerase